MAMFSVTPIPVLEDNYAYLLRCRQTSKAALVDPAESDKVLEALKSWQGKPEVTHVLTTHKHWDHSGGNEDIKKALPHVTVVGGADDDVPACTMPVKDGDSFTVGNVNIKVMHVPCHTRGHVLYYATSGNHGALFSGDTLFVGGCGRFFEGTAEQMYNALCVKVAGLPDNTKIYCGHEYTLNNYRFAVDAEPENKELEAAYIDAKARRSNGVPTVPTTVELEKQTNPFMRVAEPTIKAYTKAEAPIEVMKKLREMKNNFGLGSGKRNKI